MSKVYSRLLVTLSVGGDIKNVVCEDVDEAEALEMCKAAGVYQVIDADGGDVLYVGPEDKLTHSTPDMWLPVDVIVHSDEQCAEENCHNLVDDLSNKCHYHY